jgi:hypothetical protein
VSSVTSTLAAEVDADGAAEQDLDVALAAEDRADRVRDLGGAEAGHRHLVEQRLKQVVVAAVDDA